MKCPVCKAYIEDKHLRTHDFNNQKYKLYHCLRCDLQFWHPLKIVLGLYKNKTDNVCQKELSFHQKYFFKHFPLKKGKLLDVGCGDGMFLMEAQRVGFDVYGVDFNEKRIRIARKKFNVRNVYTMGLDEFVNFAKERRLTFDAITFFDVLEHQDDPMRFLEMTKELLKPGGWVAGGVPHRDRLWANKERKLSSLGDFPPLHFLWFSKDSLTNLFSSKDFDIRNYSPPVDLPFLSTYLESLILGNFGQNLKTFIKKIFLGKDKISPSLDIVEKTEVNPSRNALLKILKFLRKLRNCIFLPLALIFLRPINKRGKTVYFQGTLK